MMRLNYHMLCRKIIVFIFVLIGNFMRTLDKNWFCVLFKWKISRFPFDTKNFTGYSFAFLLQCILSWHNFCISSCMISFGIGSFLFGIAISKDLKNYQNLINKSAKIQKNQISTKKYIARFIELQRIMKQLSHSGVYYTHLMNENLKKINFSFKVTGNVFGFVSTNVGDSISMVHRNIVYHTATIWNGTSLVDFFYFNF